LRTDDEGWYWQLDFGSKLTIVFLLYLPMPLSTILHLNDGQGNRLSYIYLVLYI